MFLLENVLILALVLGIGVHLYAFIRPGVGQATRRRMMTEEWVAALVFVVLPALVILASLLTVKIFVDRYVLWSAIGMGIWLAVLLHEALRGSQVAAMVLLAPLLLWSVRTIRTEAPSTLRYSGSLQQQIQTLPTERTPILIPHVHDFMEIWFYSSEELRSKVGLLRQSGIGVPLQKRGFSLADTGGVASPFPHRRRGLRSIYQGTSAFHGCRGRRGRLDCSALASIQFPVRSDRGLRPSFRSARSVRQPNDAKGHRGEVGAVTAASRDGRCCRWLGRVGLGRVRAIRCGHLPQTGERLQERGLPGRGALERLSRQLQRVFPSGVGREVGSALDLSTIDDATRRPPWTHVGGSVRDSSSGPLSLRIWTALADVAAAQHRIVTSWVKPGLVPVERVHPHYAIEGTIVIDSDLGSPLR